MQALLRQPFVVLLVGFAALAMLVPAIHAATADQYRVGRAFLQSAVLLGVLAALLAAAMTGFRPANVARSHLAQLAGGFVLLPVLLALPLWRLAPGTGLLDGWFDMLACFTGTGAVLSLPGAPQSLLLWRGIVGWSGGLLTLIAAVSILAPMTLGGFEVLTAQQAGQGAGGASTGRGRAPMVSQIARIPDPSERMRRYAGQIAPVYLGLTLALWFALVVAGDSALAGIGRAMAVLSTSGIETGPAGSGRVGEVLCLGFFTFALSRAAMPLSHRRTAGPGLLQDREFRLALTLGGVLAVGLVGLALQRGAGIDTLWAGLFDAMSFLTGTGLTAASAAETPLLPWLALAALALIGGGIATTSGGLKLLRLGAILSHARHEAERLLHPHAVGRAGSGARDLRRQGGQVAWIFALLLILALAMALLGLTLFGLGLEPALILATAALTNTGPLATWAGAAPDVWADLPVLAKLLLMGLMVLGRLETLTLVALFAAPPWRQRNQPVA